jgi:hypothetical protein
MFHMHRSLAFALALAVSATAASAQPTASLPGGFAFTDWLTVNNAPVGGGAVDDRDVVYFLKEKEIGGLQSWLIFFDPNGSQSVSGTVTFASSIVSLFTSTTDVTVTSAAYQLTPTVTYATDAATGLEAADAASFARNTLSFDWTASDPGDHVRVLTTVVPEPSTYALLATGLAVVVAMSRRRRLGA